MGIQSYLKRVSKATKDIKSAIEEKGVSVAQCDGFETLANKIRAIQTGSSSDGSELFTVLAFTSSQSKPKTPTGGTFTASSISYPSGWSDGGGLSKNIWMSYVIFKGDGSVYKNWVSPILINGVITDSGDPIDLTDLATKTWVLEQVKQGVAGVSSINGLTGAVSVVKGSDNVTITEDGKNIKISVDGTALEGDTFKEFILYTTSASNSVAPEVPEADTTWDEDTDSLINLPTGWRKLAVPTTSAKYVWQITGIFSQKTRKISGSWYGPICLTGESGPKGEDGDEKEYAYALTATSPMGEYPTVDSTGTDNNGKSNSDDGYLPKIVFSATESVQTTADKQSPSEAKAYLYETSRRIHKGEKLEWAKPTLCAMWTYAGLSDDEIDKIKEEVSSKVADQVSEANTKVANVESRLNSIQGTDGKFTVDATKGIVSAITSYKDENQTSYADIIADAASASISNQVGSKISDGVNETLAGAGLTLDGLKGVVDQWGVFKDGDPSNENTLNYVKQTLNAHGASITSAATSIEKNGEEVASVKNAMTTWDAKTATIENNVSKCQYVWVKRSTTDTIPDTDPVIYKIIEDTPYDWDSEKYSTLEAYEASMLNGTNTDHPGKWERLLLAEELSQIRQTPGEIDLTAISGEQAAGIVIKANNEATGKSTILMSAENVNFSGTIKAPDAYFEGIHVVKGSITEGEISNAKINSCTINSRIISANYEADKTGFLLDAQNSEYGIYGKNDKGQQFKLTNNSITVPAANISNLSSAIGEFGFVKAGEITANEINATSTTDSSTKTAIMNADKFSIAVKGTSGESGEIYIGIVPEYTVDSVTYKNMPVLYMTYSDGAGNEYTKYLDPKIWISPTENVIYVPDKTYYSSINELQMSTPITLYRKTKNGKNVDNLLYTVNSEASGYLPYSGTVYSNKVYMEKVTETPVYDFTTATDSLSACVENRLGIDPATLQFNFEVPSISRLNVSEGLAFSTTTKEDTLYVTFMDGGKQYHAKTNFVIPSDSGDEYPGTYETSPLKGVNNIALTGEFFTSNSDGVFTKTTSNSVSITFYGESNSNEIVTIASGTKFKFASSKEIGPAPKSETTWTNVTDLELKSYYDVVISN